MDVNWYAAETLVQETLHARRAKAAMARLAATARPYRVRRGIGAALIKLGRALVGESSAPVSEQTPGERRDAMMASDCPGSAAG